MQSSAELGLRFIERCSTASAAAAASDFLATIRQLGFSAAACGAWTGIGKNRRHRFFFVDWPADWLEFYNKGGWFEHDLLPAEARRRIAPFLWSDLLNSKLTDKQTALYEAGWDYGWRNVFCVPIHGPGSLQGLVTVAARQEFSLTSGDRAVLEIMARTIWEHCRTSEAFGTYAPDRARNSVRARSSACNGRQPANRIPTLRLSSVSNRRRRISTSSRQKNGLA
jgi:LuxR family quorum sensing-dependent transcriptional regulator